MEHTLVPDVTGTNANWTLLADCETAAVPMSFVGQFHSARRCIDPPQIEMSQVSGAAAYDVMVSGFAESEVVHRATSASSTVDLAHIWPKLPIGMLQLTGRAFGATGDLLGVTPLKTLVKAPDWTDRVVVAADYRAAGSQVIDYLCDRLPVARMHPDDPAYIWHASAKPVGPETGTDLQFPALSYAMLINLFLTGTELGLRDDLIERSRQLADFLIEHPVIDEGPLAGLPMSTMGQDGKGGLFEEERTTLVRIGWTGVTMLNLADATGDQKYLDYALRLGEVLLTTQQKDGSWPYRVRLADAEILERYTAAGTMALLLLDPLAERTADVRYKDAFNQGLAWVLENPVKTGLWQQMYEDVPSLADFDNLEQWAALETLLLLFRREHPEALTVGRKLIRYVEDQFVLFGDEASLSVPYLPHTPSVMEQYRCYWPMDVHTSNYVKAVLALYDATGEQVWADKAVAAANAVVACQSPDGRLSTLVPDRRFGTTPPFTDWFNCMAHAADVLLTHGPRLTEISRKKGGISRDSID